MTATPPYWSIVSPYYWNAYYSIIDARNAVLDAIFKMSVERRQKITRFSKEIADNVVRKLLDKLNATIGNNLDSKLLHLVGAYSKVDLGMQAIPVKFSGATTTKDGRTVVAFPEFTFDLSEYYNQLKQTANMLDRRFFLLRWEIGALPIEGDFEDVNYEYKICTDFVGLYDGFLTFRVLCDDVEGLKAVNFNKYGKLFRFAEFGLFEYPADVYLVEGVYGSWYGFAFNFGTPESPQYDVWGLYSPSGYVLYLDAEGKYRSITYGHSFFITNTRTDDTVLELCFLNYKMKIGPDMSVVYVTLQDQHGREKLTPLISKTPHLSGVYIDAVSLDQSYCITGEPENRPVSDLDYWYVSIA